MSSVTYINRPKNTYTICFTRALDTIAYVRTIRAISLHHAQTKLGVDRMLWYKRGDR